MILETERLVLRSWSPADAPALLAIYSDPLVTQHIPHVQLRDLPAAEAKVREMMKLEEEKGFTLWAVTFQNELVGICGFRTAPEPGALEIGFAFRRDVWRRGYAREAATACLRWGEERGMRRAVALTRPANEASRRVLDSLGFHDTGRRSPDGEWCIYESMRHSAA